MTPEQDIELVNGLIGHPWSEVENCWWLVRKVTFARLGHMLPEANVQDREFMNDVGALMRTAHGLGWRLVREKPQDCDVILAHGLTGRHIGCMVRLGGDLRVLHNEGSVQNPSPGVLWEPLTSFTQRYSRLECWRLSSS